MQIVEIDKHIEFLLEEIETLCDDGEDVSELEKMLEIAQNAKKNGRCYRVIQKILWFSLGREQDKALSLRV